MSRSSTQVSEAVTSSLDFLVRLSNREQLYSFSLGSFIHPSNSKYHFENLKILQSIKDPLHYGDIYNKFVKGSVIDNPELVQAVRHNIVNTASRFSESVEKTIATSYESEHQVRLNYKILSESVKLTVNSLLGAGRRFKPGLQPLSIGDLGSKIKASASGGLPRIRDKKGIFRDNMMEIMRGVYNGTFTLEGIEKYPASLGLRKQFKRDIKFRAVSFYLWPVVAAEMVFLFNIVAGLPSDSSYSGHLTAVGKSKLTRS
jgi:hypothetical protein